MLVVGSVQALTGAIFLDGAATSPTFLSAFGLIERRVPPEVLAAGITWVTTGIGTAPGASLAGWVVDSFVAQNGPRVSIATAALALLTMVAGQREFAGNDPDQKFAGRSQA